MRPLASLPLDEARAITTLLFDLDDTLLTHGKLTRSAYGALHDLADAGFDLVAVTGRPSGWGEIVARQWPVLGVVAENGAVLLRREGAGIHVSLRGTDATRALGHASRNAIVAAVRAELPALDLADDNRARLTDVTLDVGERVKVPGDQVARARAIIASFGARSILSSVHLHITFEGDDKASGALRFLREQRSLDASLSRVRAAFVGDSENDSACFACFRTTFGVANVAQWVPRLSLPPRYVTPSPMGEGFVELARALIAAKKQPSA
ncbi:MAG: HAD hydrolase family protein [Polyangiales bacterium]